jgi:hypothetical protein
LPVTQGNYEESQESAKFVKEATGATSATVGIVVDRELVDSLSLKVLFPY